MIFSWDGHLPIGIQASIFDHCGPNQVSDDIKFSSRPSKVEILQNLCQKSAESFKNNFY